MRTWLFWDWWQIEHQKNAEIRQGRPLWVMEGTYEDPYFANFGAKPCVWRDEDRGCFRMVYIGSGHPLTLMAAQSLDGVHWEPLDTPDIVPEGGKLAPHHLFTMPNSGGGPVNLLDGPLGRRFSLFFSHRGGSKAAPTVVGDSPVFHELITGPGAKPYAGHNCIAGSADGLNWKVEKKAFFDRPGWFPEPHFTAVYSERIGKYVMFTRHGWGDRRIAAHQSADGLNWEPPYHVMQPDLQDPPHLQLYGMPVIRYEGWYVGLLFTAHFANAERLDRWNQLAGSVDCQLAYSPDGVTFQRGLRKPFIPLNEPGEPGAGVLFTTSMVEQGNELWFYSSGTPALHFQHSGRQFCRKGEAPPAHILLHKLRKDGFTYIASKGNWATIQTKPMLLQEGRLEMNVLGPHGEGLFQLCDAMSAPLPGFSFEDCVPFEGGDELAFPLRWKNADLKSVAGGQAVRLEVKFRNLRIHALRGDFHFADALDLARSNDGQPLEIGPFDF